MILGIVQKIKTTEDTEKYKVIIKFIYNPLYPYLTFCEHYSYKVRCPCSRVLLNIIKLLGGYYGKVGM